MAGFENFLQMGLIGEMNYSALFALGCSSAAKCLGWFNCLVIVAGLLGIAASFGVGIVGRISLAVIALTSTTLAYVCEDGKVDTFAIALGLGAIFWASQYAGRRRVGVLAMAGLLAGMSIIAKASFAVTIVPMVSMLVIWPAPGEGGRKFFSPGNLAPMIGSLAIMGLFVLLAMAPHFWKNWVLYHDPLAPFITTNPAWKSSMHTDYIFFAKGWQFYLSYPLIPFMGKYESQAGNISILFAAFLPLIFVGASRGASGSTNRLLVAGLISMAVYLAVLFICFQPRHYILAMLVIAIPICAGIDRAYSSAGAIVRAVIIAAAAVLLLFMIKSESLMAADGVKCAIGVKDRSQVVGDYAVACGKLNALASPGTKIVRALPYCYWLRSDLLINSCSFNDMSHLAKLSPADRWRWLRESGFRYIIYDKNYDLHRQKIASDRLVTVIDWGLAAKVELDLGVCPPGIKVAPVISQSSLTVLEISGAD